MTAPLTATTPSADSVTVARMRADHADEVARLQRRIDQLEAALERAGLTPTEASRLPTEADIASARMDDFDPANAWSGGDATFEEKLAAKAFFREDAVEERSRRWLLGPS